MLDWLGKPISRNASNSLQWLTESKAFDEHNDEG